VNYKRVKLFEGTCAVSSSTDGEWSWRPVIVCGRALWGSNHKAECKAEAV
jgi:hypothetical protein